MVITKTFITRENGFPEKVTLQEVSRETLTAQSQMETILTNNGIDASTSTTIIQDMKDQGLL